MTRRTLYVAAALVAATLIGLPILSTLSGSDHQAPTIIHASRLAGIAGAGISGMQVQNMDASQSATIVVDLYRQAGGGPVAIARSNVSAGSAANLYLPSEPALQNGAYASIVSSDRSIRVIARTDWSNTGGALMVNDSQPGTDVIVPFSMKQFENQTSLPSIQNTDTSMQANVRIDFVKLGETQPLTTLNVAIAPGTSTTLDLGKNSGFAAVAPGTAGYLRITSTTPIAVENIVDVESSQRGVYGHEGIPVEMAAGKLFAPVAHAGAPQDPQVATSAALDTLMMVVNPGSTAADITIRYTGIGGTCQGQTYTHPAFNLAAGASALVAQAPGAAYPPVAASPLPAGCNAAAVIEATGGAVVASVVDRQGAGTVAAAYNALTAGEGATTVHLPMVRRNHTGSRLTTAIQVMNLGASAANATLTWRDMAGTPVTGCGADCTAAIPVGSAHLFWPPSIAAIPDGTYGSAVVTGDQPLGVVVTDIALAGGNDMVSYVGLADGPGGGGPPSGGSRYVPLVGRNSSGNPTPTPALTATPPMSTATPMLPTSTPAMWTATPMLPTSTPAPPTATTEPPTSIPPAGNVSDAVRSKVPPAVINAALAHPERINGWRQPRDAGKPVSPANPLRECLTLVDPGKPYHPLFNGLVFKAGCP